MSKIEGTDFNFKKLKKVYKIPMVLTAFLAALVGGLVATFIRVSHLSLALDKGAASITTILIISLTVCMAVAQMTFINKAI